MEFRKNADLDSKIHIEVQKCFIYVRSHFGSHIINLLRRPNFSRVFKLLTNVNLL